MIPGGMFSPPKWRRTLELLLTCHFVSVFNHLDKCLLSRRCVWNEFNGFFFFFIQLNNSVLRTLKKVLMCVFPCFSGHSLYPLVMSQIHFTSAKSEKLKNVLFENLILAWRRSHVSFLCLTSSTPLCVQVSCACPRAWTCTGTSSARAGAASVQATARPSCAHWSSRCWPPGWAASQSWVSTMSPELGNTYIHVLLWRNKSIFWF